MKFPWTSIYNLERLNKSFYSTEAYALTKKKKKDPSNIKRDAEFQFSKRSAGL